MKNYQSLKHTTLRTQIPRNIHSEVPPKTMIICVENFDEHCRLGQAKELNDPCGIYSVCVCFSVLNWC